jgi:hypothetical protein
LTDTDAGTDEAKIVLFEHAIYGYALEIARAGQKAMMPGIEGPGYQVQAGKPTSELFAAIALVIGSIMRARTGCRNGCRTLARRWGS